MERITGTNSVRDAVQALRERLQQLPCGHGGRRSEDVASLSTGCAAFDRLLPDGGWRRGTLVEWLADGRGSGAGTLAMIAAREVARPGGAIVVMDNRGDFYPPAAAVLGVDLENLVVIQAATEKDRLWALDQTLRCEGVAAVWAPQDKLDPHTFRRLQLAAEGSGAIGLLVRDRQVRGLPSWSYVQLFVQPSVEVTSGGRSARGEQVGKQGLGGLMKTEPTALAAGDETVLVQPIRPEASAYGSQENAFLSVQGLGGGNGGTALPPPRGRAHHREEGAGSDRRMRVELIRSHHGQSGGWVELCIDEVTGAICEARRTDEPHLVHPSSQLARAARGRRPAGA